MFVTVLLVGPPALLVFWLYVMFLIWTKDVSMFKYIAQMNALRKTNLNYQKKRRESIDKITILRSNARESLLKKIIPIVEAYTKENDISLVVDKKYILGGNPEIDITKLIVEKLNKELPSLNLQ